jgi:hypothetical protein
MVLTSGTCRYPQSSPSMILASSGLEEPSLQTASFLGKFSTASGLSMCSVGTRMIAYVLVDSNFGTTASPFLPLPTSAVAPEPVQGSSLPETSTVTPAVLYVRATAQFRLSSLLKMLIPLGARREQTVWTQNGRAYFAFDTLNEATHACSQGWSLPSLVHITQTADARSLLQSSSRSRPS